MKLWNLCARFSSLLLLLLSFFWALQDGLKIDWWDRSLLLLLCGGVALFVTLIFCSRISAGIGSALVLVFALWLETACRSRMILELQRIRHHLVPLVNQYYRTYYDEGKAVPDEGSGIFLLFCALILGVAFGIPIAVKRWRVLLAVPLFFAFVCGPLVGFAPGLGAMAALVGGLGIQLVIWKDEKSAGEKRARVLCALLLLFASLISALAAGPLTERFMVYHQPLKQYQLSVEDRVLQSLDKSRAWDSFLWRLGYYQQASVLTNQPPDLSDAVILEFITQKLPTAPVYLKNFNGSIYDRGSWSDPLKETFSSFAREQGREAEDYGAEVLSQWYRTMQASGEEPQQFAIHVFRHTGSFSPVPYCSALPDGAAVIGDSGIRMENDNYWGQGYFVSAGQGAYYRQILEQKLRGGEGDTLADVNEEAVESKAILADADGETVKSKAAAANADTKAGTDGDLAAGSVADASAPDPVLGLEQAYSNYVEDTYILLPKGQLSHLREQPVESLKSLEGCSYSMNLLPAEADWDLTEYFVLRQQKGYCMHFASAYTLINRIGRIPARYAGGYLVFPQDFVPNQDGTYTARVTGKRAHAWMEYYDPQKGWYPVEVTPATGDVLRAIQDVQARMASPRVKPHPVVPQAETGTPAGQKQDESTETPTPQMKEQDKKEQKNIQSEQEVRQGQEQASPAASPQDGAASSARLAALWPIVLPLLLLALLWFLNALRLFLLCRRRQQQFYHADDRQKAAAVIDEVFRLLSLLGLPYEPETDDLTYARTVNEQLACFAQAEFVPWMEAARQARYGGTAMQPEQMQCLFEVYDILFQYTKTELKWHQRLWQIYGTGALARN